ncbi:MAG TPA: J domain-containing protein [Edaphocola sp.]|nr:J domain-containing protein [Edaphocola sp.]
MSLNYYQVLEIAPNAELSAIKKAYRHLAHNYHPDKNSSPLKNKHFLLIHEAYKTLSDPILKKAYDRKMAFNNSINFSPKINITPEQTLQHIHKYADAIVIKKKYSMSESLKKDFLLDILEEEKMDVFLAKANPEQTEDFIYYTFLIAEILSFKNRNEVFNRLLIIFENDILIAQKVKSINRENKLNDWYQQYQVLLLVLVGILLCICMYFYASSFRY